MSSTEHKEKSLCKILDETIFDLKPEKRVIAVGVLNADVNEEITKIYTKLTELFKSHMSKFINDTDIIININKRILTDIKNNIYVYRECDKEYPELWYDRNSVDVFMEQVKSVYLTEVVEIFTLDINNDIIKKIIGYQPAINIGNSIEIAQSHMNNIRDKRKRDDIIENLKSDFIKIRTIIIEEYISNLKCDYLTIFDLEDVRQNREKYIQRRISNIEPDTFVQNYGHNFELYDNSVREINNDIFFKLKFMTLLSMYITRDELRATSDTYFNNYIKTNFDDFPFTDEIKFTTRISKVSVDSKYIKKSTKRYYTKILGQISNHRYVEIECNPKYKPYTSEEKEKIQDLYPDKAQQIIEIGKLFSIGLFKFGNTGNIVVYMNNKESSICHLRNIECKNTFYKLKKGDTIKYRKDGELDSKILYGLILFDSCIKNITVLRFDQGVKTFKQFILKIIKTTTIPEKYLTQIKKSLNDRSWTDIDWYERYDKFIPEIFKKADDAEIIENEEWTKKDWDEKAASYVASYLTLPSNPLYRKCRTFEECVKIGISAIENTLSKNLDFLISNNNIQKIYPIDGYLEMNPIENIDDCNKRCASDINTDILSNVPVGRNKYITRGDIIDSTRKILPSKKELTTQEILNKTRKEAEGLKSYTNSLESKGNKTYEILSVLLFYFIYGSFSSDHFIGNKSIIFDQIGYILNTKYAADIWTQIRRLVMKVKHAIAEDDIDSLDCHLFAELFVSEPAILYNLFYNTLPYRYLVAHMNSYIYDLHRSIYYIDSELINDAFDYYNTPIANALFQKGIITQKQSVNFAVRFLEQDIEYFNDLANNPGHNAIMKNIGMSTYQIDKVSKFINLYQANKNKNTMQYRFNKAKEFGNFNELKKIITDYQKIELRFNKDVKVTELRKLDTEDQFTKYAEQEFNNIFRIQFNPIYLDKSFTTDYEFHVKNPTVCTLNYYYIYNSIHELFSDDNDCNKIMLELKHNDNEYIINDDLLSLVFLVRTIREYTMDRNLIKLAFNLNKYNGIYLYILELVLSYNTLSQDNEYLGEIKINDSPYLNSISQDKNNIVILLKNSPKYKEFKSILIQINNASVKENDDSWNSVFEMDQHISNGHLIHIIKGHITTIIDIFNHWTIDTNGYELIFNNLRFIFGDKYSQFVNTFFKKYTHYLKFNPLYIRDDSDTLFITDIYALNKYDLKCHLLTYKDIVNYIIFSKFYHSYRDMDHKYDYENYNDDFSNIIKHFNIDYDDEDIHIHIEEIIKHVNETQNEIHNEKYNDVLGYEEFQIKQIQKLIELSDKPIFEITSINTFMHPITFKRLVNDGLYDKQFEMLIKVCDAKYQILYHYYYKINEKCTSKLNAFFSGEKSIEYTRIATLVMYAHIKFAAILNFYIDSSRKETTQYINYFPNNIINKFCKMYISSTSIDRTVNNLLEIHYKRLAYNIDRRLKPLQYSLDENIIRSTNDKVNYMYYLNRFVDENRYNIFNTNSQLKDYLNTNTHIQKLYQYYNEKNVSAALEYYKRIIDTIYDANELRCIIMARVACEYRIETENFNKPQNMILETTIEMLDTTIEMLEDNIKNYSYLQKNLIYDDFMRDIYSFELDAIDEMTFNMNSYKSQLEYNRNELRIIFNICVACISKDTVLQATKGYFEMIDTLYKNKSNYIYTNVDSDDSLNGTHTVIKKYIYNKIDNIRNYMNNSEHEIKVGDDWDTISHEFYDFAKILTYDIKDNWEFTIDSMTEFLEYIYKNHFEIIKYLSSRLTIATYLYDIYIRKEGYNKQDLRFELKYLQYVIDYVFTHVNTFDGVSSLP